jgi:hypothetical protein
MDTVNANKRWTTIYWCVDKLEESHKVTRRAKERASLLKISDINEISFFGSLLVYSVSGNANSMFKTDAVTVTRSANKSDSISFNPRLNFRPRFVIRG